MVSVIPESDRMLRLRMSYDDYLRLPESGRAEYVDGEVVVSPQPTRGHNLTQRRVANLLEAALDVSLEVVTEAGWKRGNRIRIPDVAVFRVAEDVSITEQVPILVVEVLSPSTRSEGTVRKSHEYAQAGIDQYWIVDRQHRTLEVYLNTGDGWDVLLELDSGHPHGEVIVGEHGVVCVDLVALLDR